ncbi:hypothetical protein BJP34_10045 [Moorena producens PAL-8-15-08-1]|uniref:Uncharacterized protein n=1 Tax=Moorena producens PAL-8-15-08-1 TaxID=1458985 RepID=A0A1D8TQA4_9CYAN|nr:hypothetical protein BJP34_10045 [Moorena producens PAL-8-15-08-1]
MAISPQLSAISYQLMRVCPSVEACATVEACALSYQLSAISYQLSAISYQLSAIRVAWPTAKADD